ncbi:MAG: hypothetical protein IPK79_10575 [Vampirovibrionales bacterium]|nr:hypothetical protein [Vampirovibrionales bacterium]
MTTTRIDFSAITTPSALGERVCKAMETFTRLAPPQEFAPARIMTFDEALFQPGDSQGFFGPLTPGFGRKAGR